MQVGAVTIVAPLNVPSLLGGTPANSTPRTSTPAGADAEGQHRHDRLERRSLAKTALTHDGKLCDADKTGSDPANPAKQPAKAA